MTTDGIQWDDEPAADPHAGIAWDKEDQDQKDVARNLVHGGQNSYFPNMATGIGKEIAQLARKGVNLLNINGARTNQDDEFGSESNIARHKVEDQPSFDAPGGRFGQIVADTGVGSAVGGPVESLAAKGVGSILGNSVLARAATRGISGAAGGATNSVITADPGQRGEAALEGAGAGAGLNLLEGGLKRTLLQGVVKKSPDLQTLEGDIARANAVPNSPQRKLFVPVSQGYDPEDSTSAIVGKFFKSALPYAPGVETQLTNQARQAGETVRASMLQRSSPEGYIVPENAGKDMQLSTSLVKDQYDKVYNDLRQVNNITIPKNFDDSLKARIQAADPQIPVSDIDQHVARVRQDLEHQAENSNDGKINGWNLKNTRDNVQALNTELPMAQRTAMTGETKGYLDDMFGDKLRQAFNLNHPNTQEILASYKNNAPNYENFRPLQQSVQAFKKKHGDFPFGNVAGRANDMTDIQGMDQDAFNVLGQKPAQISQAGRLLTYPILLASAKMGLGLPGTLGVAAGANAMASKTFQKGLYGDLKPQAAITALMDKYPELAKALGYLPQAALTTDIGREN